METESRRPGGQSSPILLDQLRQTGLRDLRKKGRLVSGRALGQLEKFMTCGSLRCQKNR